MDFFPSRYAQEVNNTARGNFGTFLTTGTRDQFPKEHELLVAACTVAHKALGPEGQSVRPMNVCDKLAVFENECVARVKEAVVDFVDKHVSEEDTAQASSKFSPLLAQFKNTPDSMFPWVSLVLFACMKHYHDSMELRKMKESMQNGHGRGGYARGHHHPARGGGRQEGQEGRYQGEGGGASCGNGNRASGGGGQRDGEGSNVFR
jgi:hypothetical protein